MYYKFINYRVYYLLVLLLYYIPYKYYNNLPLNCFFHNYIRKWSYWLFPVGLIHCKSRINLLANLKETNIKNKIHSKFNVGPFALAPRTISLLLFSFCTRYRQLKYLQLFTKKRSSVSVLNINSVSKFSFTFIHFFFFSCFTSFSVTFVESISLSQMAERVHPADSPPQSGQFSGNFSSGEFPRKPAPPPATYVIQVPKDQIYRVPPPENAHRLQLLSRKKPNRSRCRCCFCYFLAAIVILVVLAGISFAVLYVVFRPEAPKYSVEGFSVSGINLTSPSPISPRFNVTVRSRNGNGKLGIYYEKGSSVDVFYGDVALCNGALPVFYQPANNVTLVKTALTGSRIQLTSGARKEMRNELSKKTMPFKLKIKAPVKIKVGSVKTWTVTVKVNCDVTVDKLTAPSRIVSRKCSHDVDLWWFSIFLSKNCKWPKKKKTRVQRLFWIYRILLNVFLLLIAF